MAPSEIQEHVDRTDRSGYRFVRTLLTSILVLIGSAIGGGLAMNAALAPWPYQPAPNWRTPPFAVAMASDTWANEGALIVPASSYGACTDAGSGLCVVNGGWQLANPVAEALVFSNATPFELSNASGTTTIKSDTTGTLDITNGATSTSNAVTLEAPGGTGFSLQLAGTGQANEIRFASSSVTPIIQSQATTVDAFASNAAGASPLNLWDFQRGGSTQSFIANGGGFNGPQVSVSATGSGSSAAVALTGNGAQIAFTSTANAGAIASSATTNNIDGLDVTCAGCTTSAANQNAAVFKLTQPAGSNTNMLGLTYTGTGCNSAACFSTLSAASNAVTWSFYAPTNSSRLIINCPNDGTIDVCTGATGNIVEVDKGGAQQFKIATSGNVSAVTGDLIDAGGNITATSASTGKAEIVSGNAAACGSTAQCSGAIVMGTGVLEQATTCAQTVVHSAGTTSTLSLQAGGWMCKLTSSSTASDVTFQLTFPGGPTLTNIPGCFVSSLISGTTFSVAPSTTQCVITASTGIAANTAFAYVWIVRNGP